MRKLLIEILHYKQILPHLFCTTEILNSINFNQSNSSSHIILQDFYCPQENATQNRCSNVKGNKLFNKYYWHFSGHAFHLFNIFD